MAKAAKSPKPAKRAPTRTEDTAEAKATIPAKKAAAEEQFAKADAAGDPEFLALRRANSGF